MVQTAGDANDRLPFINNLKFIGSMEKAGELTRWTVALIGGGEGTAAAFGADAAIRVLKRKYKTLDDRRYSTGRLMSPRDEAIDLDERAWNAALEVTRETWKADPGQFQDRQPTEAPNGPAIRRVRGLGAPGVPPHPVREHCSPDAVMASAGDRVR